MPGANDTNGVYKYAEDDLVASPNWSAYLNKVGTSISTVFTNTVLRKSIRGVGSLNGIPASVNGLGGIVATISVPPGTWKLEATGFFDIAGTSIQRYTAQLVFNGPTITQAVTFQPGTNASATPFALCDVLTFAVAQTITVRVFTSAVGGTQQANNVRLIATPANL